MPSVNLNTFHRTTQEERMDESQKFDIRLGYRTVFSKSTGSLYKSPTNQFLQAVKKGDLDAIKEIIKGTTCYNKDRQVFSYEVGYLY